MPIPSVYSGRILVSDPKGHICFTVFVEIAAAANYFIKALTGCPRPGQSLQLWQLEHPDVRRYNIRLWYAYSVCIITFNIHD